MLLSFSKPCLQQWQLHQYDRALAIVFAMQDTAPRASLASLFAPPDDADSATAAGGSDATRDAEESRVSAGEGSSDGTQEKYIERRSAVGPRVSIVGPLPDIPRWASLRASCVHNSSCEDWDCVELNQPYEATWSQKSDSC